MKKDEIRQDPIKDKIIEGLNYLGQNKSIVTNIFIVLLVIIGGFSYYNTVKFKSVGQAASLGGVAQNSYNVAPTVNVLNDFQTIIDSYPNTPSASHAYIYLLSDAYNNNDTLKLKHLLENYNIKISDQILASRVYELKANFTDIADDKVNNYLKAASLSTKSSQGKIDLALANLYIEMNEITKAKEILQQYLDDDSNLVMKNSAKELMKYIANK